MNVEYFYHTVKTLVQFDKNWERFGLVLTVGFLLDSRQLKRPIVLLRRKPDILD